MTNLFSKRQKQLRKEVSDVYQYDDIAHAIGERSFQDPGKIETALRMIGLNNFWEHVSDTLNVAADHQKRQIIRYVRRRHSIVHAGDLGTAKKNRHRVRKITPEFAIECIDHIEKFIHAADNVINAQI